MRHGEYEFRDIFELPLAPELAEELLWRSDVLLTSKGKRICARIIMERGIREGHSPHFIMCDFIIRASDLTQTEKTHYRLSLSSEVRALIVSRIKPGLRNAALVVWEELADRLCRVEKVLLGWPEDRL